MLHFLLLYGYIYYNGFPSKAGDGDARHLFERIPPFDSYPSLLHFLIISIILRSWYKLSYSWMGLPDVVQTSVIAYYYYFEDSNVKSEEIQKENESGDSWISKLTIYYIIYYLIGFVIIARSLIYLHSSWTLLTGNVHTNSHDRIMERIDEIMNRLDDADKPVDDEAAKAAEDKSFQEFKECKPEPKKGRKPPPGRIPNPLNRSPLHQIRQTPQNSSVLRDVVPWLGVISSTIVYAVLCICAYRYASRDSTLYTDCWKVKELGKPDGVYQLQRDVNTNRTVPVPVS